ncbi:hypothetical protein N474_10455 [Pseudoalteromonas luteoviolacea CPMOR-2]|uniref:Uncharacterized protein n=1 Tax=Pseudoalteromonas luteoviolacea DSM 6061 TaxID=1365250 RepID=A0A161XXT2_9GAMM|nr:hypothetical protein N475_15280 [Pseudoalteromonas luteoviolacea DSM 6061]KZN57034.1 hypothetical protein N474_10455 [Pseudoalteromonas luteoviolacea CPMOR-2]
MKSTVLLTRKTLARLDNSGNFNFKTANEQATQRARLKCSHNKTITIRRCKSRSI